MPLMLHYRALHSAHRTRDVDDADVFLIPAYNFKPSPEVPCANGTDLFETLAELNPRLKDVGKKEGRRSCVSSHPKENEIHGCGSKLTGSILR